MKHFNHQSASLVLVPSLQAVKLSACSGCGAPHPLAMKPARDVDHCPCCGDPVAKPSEHRNERAVMTGWSLDAILANASHAIGNFLFALAQRTKPDDR